ncbi:MAG: hypothetical protein KC776_24280 [Myxococcales bacterium]|nr:hypothetical protein [Myxococcales bacterium]MCB9582783.1 hypothetical protein [Polyangiaceae bacterium]
MSAREPAIDLTGNVTDFFGNVVADAIRARGYETTEAAETYLVALLADYTRPDELSDETLSRPLTLLLEEALHAQGHERFERLRSVGDGVLYVSGFFADHLDNRGIQRTYVSTLGARAYENAAAMLRSGDPEASAPDLFAELSEKFRMFADLLADVAETLHANAPRTDRATVRLYERWLRTGSSSLAEALSARGLTPMRGRGLVH